MRVTTYGMHPEVDSVSERTVRWARSLSLVGSDLEAHAASRIQVGRLAAGTFERESVEVVQLGADLILWLYLFDDAVGEVPADWSQEQHGAALDSYCDLLDTWHCPSEASPFHLALLDLLQRATELGATAQWHQRFAADLRGYFRGCYEETPFRRDGRVPTVEEYRDLRALTVGTSAVFAVLELGLCGILPDEEAFRQEVVEARRTAALLTAWVNDVYSYPKESLVSDPLNLVSALARQYGLGIEDALSEAVEVYNLDLSELERLTDQALERGGSAELRGYLEGLCRWVHGNRDWTQHCARYF